METNNDDSNGNDNGNNGVKGNGKNPIHSLEGKVINQLIHSIDAQKAPKTKFGIKRELSTCRLTLVTMLFVGLPSYPLLFFCSINGLVTPVSRAIMLLSGS
jgi:hypothetical protein